MKTRTALTSWLPALVVGAVAAGVAYIPLQEQKEALALSLAAGAATAYTALTYLLVRRAGDQTANLARQLDVQRKSLEEARRQFETQLELTTKSTDAATAAVVEASRTRADEQAPRVVALLEAPNWPPNVDRNRSHMPQANEPRLLDAMSKHSSSDELDQEFYFSQDENQFLWLLTRGVLINEGRGAARVRLDGEAQFIAGVSPLVADRELQVPPMVGAPNRKEYLLQPGETALFEWGSGHPVKDWADAYSNPNRPDRKGRCFLIVTVFDFQEHGIIDHIYIEISGRPVEPIPGKDAAWRIVEKPDRVIGTTVYPTRRAYRNEPADNRPPPWVQT